MTVVFLASVSVLPHSKLQLINSQGLFHMSILTISYIWPILNFVADFFKLKYMIWHLFILNFILQKIGPLFQSRSLRNPILSYLKLVLPSSFVSDAYLISKLSVSFFIVYSFIHMCIHCLGHLSPPARHLLPPPANLLCFQAEPVLPSSPIFLKRRNK
jgi:hypothetical protein